MESQHMDWTDHLDSSGEIQQAFKIESFPTFIVVDKDGVIRFRQSGVGSETQSDLEDAINRALKKESDPVLAKAAAAELDAAAAAGKRPHINTGNVSKRDEVMASVADEYAVSTPNNASKAVPPAKNVYKSARLGIRYEFPEGWIAAPPEALLEANQHLQAAMRENLLKQEFQDSESMQMLPPSVLLFASRGGEGDPESPEVSSISIRAQQTKMDTVDEKRFRASMDKMASQGQMKLLAPAAGFEVAQHKFLRADFECTKAAPHYYQAIVETLANGSLLHIEIMGASPEELRQIADTLQTMKIEDEE